jgi:hypothetical protein
MIGRRITAVWKNEPAAVTALVVALAAALAVPEGWSKVICAALIVLGGAVTRSQVSPVGSAQSAPPQA